MYLLIVPDLLGRFSLKFQIGSDSILLIYREIVQKFSCQLLATD